MHLYQIQLTSRRITRDAFNSLEQQNLAILAQKLSTESKIPVLISNHDTPMTRVVLSK